MSGYESPGITFEGQNVGSYLWESFEKVSSQAMESQTRGREEQMRRKTSKNVSSSFFFFVNIESGNGQVKWLGSKDP